MRVLVEVIYIVAGVFVAMLIASLSSWSYPRGHDDIWLVAYAGMVATVAMGIGPVLRAYAEDRREFGEHGDG